MIYTLCIDVIIKTMILLVALSFRANLITNSLFASSTIPIWISFITTEICFQAIIFVQETATVVFAQVSTVVEETLLKFTTLILVFLKVRTKYCIYMLTLLVLVIPKAIRSQEFTTGIFRSAIV